MPSFCTNATLTHRIAAHQLDPPRYLCADFNASAESCAAHHVPSGACAWSDGVATDGLRCMNRCKRPPPSEPSGRSYVFFKFHKVGGSTVSRTLQAAMALVVGSPFASCPEHMDLHNKSAEALLRYRFCSMCTHHASSLPILPLFKQRAVLSASRDSRLAAIFASPASAVTMDTFCPMRPSMRNELLTGTIIRRPVDRVISKCEFRCAP